MSTEDHNASQPEPTGPSESPAAARAKHGPAFRSTVMALSAVALLAVGATASVGILGHMRPPEAMAPATPITIAAMPNWSVVTIKGQVAEIFGNKFVVQDSTGRALVETGPAGEGGKLVAKEEAVTIQGRFENGFIHARFVVHADGRVEAVGKPGGPPHHGMHGWLHRLVGEAQPSQPASTPVALPSAS